jgi:2-polyprenyl-6-hydroxyphenyl methylase/3-demethylubiquinone-9 3-methyltransferase
MIERNPLSRLITIFGAEYVLRWIPGGMHHYKKLRRPNEIEQRVNSSGLDVLERTGVRIDPLKHRLHLTPFMAVNYMFIAAQGNKGRE